MGQNAIEITMPRDTNCATGVTEPKWKAVVLKNVQMIGARNEQV